MGWSGWLDQGDRRDGLLIALAGVAMTIVGKVARARALGQAQRDVALAAARWHLLREASIATLDPRAPGYSELEREYFAACNDLARATVAYMREVNR